MKRQLPKKTVVVSYRQGCGAGSCPVSTLDELIEKVAQFSDKRLGLGTNYDHVTIEIDGHQFSIKHPNS